MNCPVCPRRDIADEAMDCPNCGVDLRPMRRVQQLDALLYNAGVVALSHGEDGKAVEKLTGALQFSPDSKHIRLLLGKALWRIGRYEDARVHWQYILEQNLGETEVEVLLRRPVPDATIQWKHQVTILRVVLVGTALFSIGCLFVLLSLRTVVGQTEHQKSTLESALAGSRHETERLQTLLANQQSTRSPMAPEDSKQIAASGINFRLLESLAENSDITVVLEKQRMTVQFKQGLFPINSVAITDDAKKQLRHFVEDLKGTSVPYRIAVEGWTDEPYSKRLAQRRAKTAVSFLRSVSLGTNVVWEARTNPESTFPFPNDTQDHRQRNRTVRFYFLR